MADFLHEQSAGPWEEALANAKHVGRAPPKEEIMEEFGYEPSNALLRRLVRQDSKRVVKVFLPDGEKYRSLGKFPIVHENGVPYVVSDKLGIKAPIETTTAGHYGLVYQVSKPGQAVLLEFLRHFDGSRDKRPEPYRMSFSPDGVPGAT